MAVFTWEGRSTQGTPQKGSIEAANEAVALLLLRRQNIQPAKIKEKPKDILADIAFLQPKVKTKDLILFTRQLSTMKDAGLPLIQGVEILANQEPNKTFQKILNQIKTDVEAGSTFADALKKHPKVFDNLYTNLVAAGELGGVLDIVAKTSGNRIVQEAIMITKASISEGKTIAEPLSKSGVFPSMVCQMVAVGESTGALDSMLIKIADFYDEEVDAAVDALTSLIEPMMMIFLGGTVGTMLAAMYLPIFKMAGAIE